MMENKILSAVYRDRSAYEEISKLINSDKDLSEIGKRLYTLASEYYETDVTASNIDIEIIKEIINKRYEKHSELLCTYIDNLSSSSVPNIVRMVRDNKLSRISTEISAAAGRGDSDRVDTLVDEYVNTRDNFKAIETDDPFEFKGSTYFLETGEAGTTLSILPKSLNIYLDGGLCRKHHILIYGVPEVGKSLLTITIACGFLRQGKKVLYIGNEDPERSMRDRVRSCLTNRSKEELYEEPEESDAIAEAKGYGLFGFAHLSPGSLRDVSILCDRHSPDILIVDQVRNLSVPRNKDGNKVTQIETACQGIRNIAQKNNLLAISVTQAADSAYNKLTLGMGDVFFSNVGAQAHADVMIGIGVNDDFENLGQRMLSFPKNKINGKHTHIAVKVYPQLSKVVSI